MCTNNIFLSRVGGPLQREAYPGVQSLTSNRNSWGVRRFSRFSRSGLANRRRAEIKVKGSGQECPLYTGGGRIFTDAFGFAPSPSKRRQNPISVGGCGIPPLRPRSGQALTSKRAMGLPQPFGAGESRSFAALRMTILWRDLLGFRKAPRKSKEGHGGIPPLRLRSGQALTSKSTTLG
jgi:hypothetical protein